MIINFTDKTTENIYNGLDSKSARKIPIVIWKIAQRKLDMIDAAAELRDLKIPPANRLEKLKAKLDGYYSIRINDQFRIIFKWINSGAANVKITDYH